MSICPEEKSDKCFRYIFTIGLALYKIHVGGYRYTEVFQKAILPCWKLILLLCIVLFFFEDRGILFPQGKLPKLNMHPQFHFLKCFVVVVAIFRE